MRRHVPLTERATLSSAEACAYLGIGERMLNDLETRGLVVSFKLSRSDAGNAPRMYRRASLDELAARLEREARDQNAAYLNTARDRLTHSRREVS